MDARAAALLCVLLAACVADPASPTPTPEPLPEAFARFQVDAVDALNAYWAPIAERVGLTYREPAIVPYRSGEVPDIGCAEDTTGDEWVEEAFYCFTDGTLAYDADFLSHVYATDGEDPALGILAHEWGHHLQSLTAEPPQSLQVELQADCYAGVFLANRGGDPTDSGVTLQAMSSFVDAGNQEYQQSSWFAFQEHGSPELRWSAFVTGALGIDDLTLCREYAEYEPQPPIELGDYTIAHLPGFHGRATDAEATLDRDGVELHLVPLEGTMGATAESIGLAIWDSYFEGFTIEDRTPAGTQATPYGGEWTTWTYVASRGPTTVVGVFRVHAHPDGDALLVDSSIEDPPVTEPLDDAELRVLMAAVLPAYGVENFLCGPGQTGERGEDGYAMSCAIEFDTP